MTYYELRTRWNWKPVRVAFIHARQGGKGYTITAHISWRGQVRLISEQQFHALVRAGRLREMQTEPMTRAQFSLAA